MLELNKIFFWIHFQDRYWAVTYVDYILNRTPKRILTMIFTVWTVAAIVSIAPLVGWKDPDFNLRVEQEKRCLISQDVGYQVFATFATFYGPLIFILILYWKIYQVSRAHFSSGIKGYFPHCVYFLFANEKLTEENYFLPYPQLLTPLQLGLVIFSVILTIKQLFFTIVFLSNY